MKAPAFPIDEDRRLAALASLDILYTPAEERFDRITRLAARTFGVPIALVSLVAENTQWFKSAQGLDAVETSREISFCGHAILDENPFVVENAAVDERFADNPLVTGDPSVSFYAGHPVRAGDGSRVGTLCLIDRTPRTFTDEDRALLRDLAELVETELQREYLNDSHVALVRQRDDLARKAMIDGLTRLWNRSAILEIAAGECARAERGKPMAVAMIDADHFKACNDTFGHQTGDRVLEELAARIRSAVRDFDAVGRYGGEEFLVVLSDCTTTAAGDVAERIRSTVADVGVATSAGFLPISVSIGVAAFNAELTSVEQLVAAADEAMYRAKHAGRNRVAVDWKR